MKAVVYIHGKGGTAEEVKHYETMFTENKVFGFDRTIKFEVDWSNNLQ